MFYRAKFPVFLYIKTHQGHNEEPDDLYSLNTFRVIKSRRMRWPGHVARFEERLILGFGGET